MNRYRHVANFSRIAIELGDLEMIDGRYYIRKQPEDMHYDMLNLAYMTELKDPRYTYRYDKPLDGVVFTYENHVHSKHLMETQNAYIFKDGINTQQRYLPKAIEQHFKGIEFSYFEPYGFYDINLYQVSPRNDNPISDWSDATGILWHQRGNYEDDNAGDLECALLDGRIIYKALYVSWLLQSERLTFINPLDQNYCLGEQYYAYNCDESGQTYPVSSYFYVDGMVRYLVLNHQHKKIIAPNFNQDSLSYTYVYERSAIQPVLMLECRDTNQQTADLFQQHLRPQLLHDVPVEPHDFIHYEYGQYLQVSGNSPLIDTLQALLQHNKLNELIFLDLVDVEPNTAFTSLFKRMPNLKYIRINLNSILKYEDKLKWNQIFADLSNKIRIGWSYLIRHYDLNQMKVKPVLPLHEEDLQNIDTYWHYLSVEEFIDSNINTLYSEDFLKFYISKIHESFLRFHGDRMMSNEHDLEFDLKNKREPTYGIDTLIQRDQGDTIPYDMPYYK